MDFEKSGHGKSWKSHGILKGRRCTNPVFSQRQSVRTIEPSELMDIVRKHVELNVQS
jgi:hypothetical protein